MKNTKKQGDIGLGAAIAYFTMKGYTVAIPLTDSQQYDLIVDIDGKLSRVQVKTTRFKGRGSYEISLSIKGGNRSSTGKLHRFDRSQVDHLFVLTEDGGSYFIPTSAIENTCALRLTERLQQFRLAS